ncbi:wd repeat-containing protein [Diaporthe eres]|uniref:WD domain-containing protein n=1 Tax=Diaporthe vaccinii TaxID=105482 RepID=A0ABR4F0D2_9PEZI|nr:wd repeat-containing protein [Diaporthe eres]
MWSDESDRPHNSSYYGSSGEASSSSSASTIPPSQSTAVLHHGPKATTSASASASEFEHYLHASYDRDPSDYDHDSEQHLSFLHSADTQSQTDDMSDDHDMDDGGAPVHYGDIANILTQGMDVDYDSEHDDDISVSHPALGGLPSPPPLMNAVPHYGTFQAQYALQYPASMLHTHPAAAMQQPPQPPHGPPEDGQEANNDIAHHVPLHHTQTTHTNFMNNPNAVALGPENYNLADFIRVWAWQNGVWQGVSRERGRYPWLDRITPQISKDLSRIEYQDLEGDSCDVQGMNWDDLGVTRSEARERRLLTYKNYVNIPRSDRWQEHHDALPCTENYFRFQRLNVRKNVNLTHFQLRNVLASTSRSQVFYPGQMAVHQFNPISGKGKIAMKAQETPHLQVSTLAAEHGTLVAGGFFGEYCFRRLDSDEEDGSGQVQEGTITNDNSGITNHVQLHLSRNSSSPRAAFASNDKGFRVLDIETDKFISDMTFPQPINCSAISPDCRLRVMVGDQQQVFITKAEADGQPEILQSLEGHEDFGFACDWADDGWTVATGFQDKSIKIWDARRWTNSRGVATPVCTLRSEMAGVRALKFSPVGSGKRVLVAAEEADFVNIIDAQTFQAKQTFDFFGEIGGVSFVNEGQDLHVLCCDRVRGGLFQLQRCGVGAERNYDVDDLRHRPYDRWWKNTTYDWHEFKTTPRQIKRHSDSRRRRRALALEPLTPF